jgi:AraC-like DNA-binding protein
MESLFFNAPDRRCFRRELLEGEGGSLVRTDLSNGLFYYEARLTARSETLRLTGSDRLYLFCFTMEGSLMLEEGRSGRKVRVGEESSALFLSARQDFAVTLHGELFLLFVADFFLNPYREDAEGGTLERLDGMLRERPSLQEADRRALDRVSFHLVRRVTKAGEERELRNLRIMGRIIELLSHRLALLGPDPGRHDPRTAEIALRARELLFRHFPHALSLSELARLCATNPTSLKRAFREVHGLTVGAYLRQLRLEEARRLLLEEEMEIGEVARRVGYRHGGHFARLFRQHFGVSPRELRCRESDFRS